MQIISRPRARRRRRISTRRSSLTGPGQLGAVSAAGPSPEPAVRSVGGKPKGHR